jgi:hypothetical protein
MALFSKREPELRELAAYVVEAARGRSLTVRRAKLVQLLYLVDVERVRGGRAPLTGVTWTRGVAGAAGEGLDETLRAVERDELKPETWGKRVETGRFGDPGRGDDWVSGTKLLVDGVVRDFAALDQNALLDHVCFETAPMRGAAGFGEPLDLERARGARARRPGSPLTPPPAPADLAARLDRWRSAHRDWLAPLTHDATAAPPGAAASEA